MLPADRFDITFAPGWTARAVVVPADLSGDRVVAALGVRPQGAVVGLTGSTATGTADSEPMVEALARGLGLAVIDNGWPLVTGATDAGIFSLIGRAAATAGALAAPWIGVAPVGLVTWPGRPAAPRSDERVPLEPHHSHFVLVEGDDWGGETAMQLTLMDALGRGGASVAVVAGGGDVARQEVLGHARARRAMLVLAGTGRLADQLADAARGASIADEQIALVAASGHVTVCDVGEGPRAVALALQAVMARQLEVPK